ncbi:MAG: T9SS type A sorting domain-containing protein, partial [Crocinitomicaceae bacterium]|nr:T9SS type A sorting domain-containing protein [Crocinitomicaceae bacterium]
NATLFNGMGPYDVYWSTGHAENDVTVTSVSNLSSGVYYLNITDLYGCKNVAKAPVPDADFSVSAISTESRCAGQPGLIDLTVSVTGGTVDDIFWSNGTTTEDLAAAPGEYSVSIHSTNNCNFFGTYEILDSALKVKLESMGANFNCLSGPNGYFDITTTGGTMPYAWDWKLNGSSVYTTQDISGIEGGMYSCTVTDDNGCALTWNKTLGNNNNVFLSVNSVTKPTCGNADGAIDIDIFGGDVPSVYSWSNGYLTEDISGLVAGSYTLTYADQAGCFSYLTVKLENQKPYQPSICLLTVDTSLVYNMVVWEKDITQDVAGFNIYRETSEYGVFQKVATRPYALESFYQDNAASPVDRSWRYYMTTYDACGGESYGSFIHKTIHVVANTSNGVDYELSWDNYEGIDYSTIDLHRYDPTNGWVTIGSDLPYGTNTFPDTPPVITGLDYLVTFNLTNTCTSTKVQDHNSSRSNKSSSVFEGGGSTAQITDEELGFISIYPNPASDMLNLHVDNPELFESYTITDINGKTISSGTIFTNNSLIDLSTFEAGVYILQLNGSNKRVVEKFIKN